MRYLLKCIQINNLDNKLEFSFDTMNPEERRICWKSFQVQKNWLQNMERWHQFAWKNSRKTSWKWNKWTCLSCKKKKKSNDELYAAKFQQIWNSWENFLFFDIKDFESKDHSTIITKYKKIGYLYNFIEIVHMLH